MVKIRLARTGAKNAPSYRIVAVDSREKRNGKSLEILGHYNPSHNPPTFEYNQERLEYWRSVGAQLTEAVENLIAGKYKYVKYEPKAAGEEGEKATAEGTAAKDKPLTEEISPPTEKKA